MFSKKLNYKKAVIALYLAIFTMTAFCPLATAANRKNCIAVAYTQENFNGACWEIYIAGEYDLWWKIDNKAPNPRMPLDLPNDSICSIRVRPGYRLTLYQHAELQGKKLILEMNTPTLGDEWNEQASSITAYRIEDETIVGRWKNSVTSDKNEFFLPTTNRSEQKIGTILQNNEDEFLELMTLGENDWYGETTDAQRIYTATYMLQLFDELGYDVSSFTGPSFSQRINNFYNWRKDLSVWRTACMVLNVDPKRYEEIFKKISIEK